MNDDSDHNDEIDADGESVDKDAQAVREKREIPAFMFRPVSGTAGEIAVEIERRRKKRGW